MDGEFAFCRYRCRTPRCVDSRRVLFALVRRHIFATTYDLRSINQRTGTNRARPGHRRKSFRVRTHRRIVDCRRMVVECRAHAA